MSDRPSRRVITHINIMSLFNPTEAELRAWAAEPGADELTGDWDLVLAWNMEPERLRLLVELAADTTLPNAPLFLRALYTWVWYVGRQQDFDSWRPYYDRWLDVAKGVRDPAVKRWRHRTRRIFQGIESFDKESWWDDYAADIASQNVDPSGEQP